MHTPKPLGGIRVLDLTHVIAGPYATYLLALMGAEVVRIEPMPGDSLRFRSGSDAVLREQGLGTGFQAQGGGKASVCLDLKTINGRDALLGLVSGADVLVENFRPGVLDRLGLTSERLTQRRPDLIHCSLSAYAPEDGRADWPAYDNVIQAASGLMALSGTPETGPLKCGAPIVDYASGMMMAFAVASALVAREKQGARHQRAQISMQETAQALMGSVVADYLATGKEPTPRGNAAGSGMPASGCFRTEAGMLAIGANEEHQMSALLEVLGLSELARDPRFADDASRRNNAKALGEEIETALADRPAAEWEILLNAAGVPAARVRSVSEAVGDTLASGACFLSGEPGLPTAPLHFNGQRPVLTCRPGPAGADMDRLPTLWRDDLEGRV
ncbi:CaiB/BaiF CoA transferase family protein [Jannaschia formosa]|uniref:CaiB/BaiF CoA transferase family protein n=1 Tax=Jannaschia formosa TaxID=2259592 RepID=UPI0014306A20|nr:CoA transferase [Jannaschia formosa]